MKPKAWTNVKQQQLIFQMGHQKELNDTEWLQHCTITEAIAEQRVLIQCTTRATVEW